MIQHWLKLSSASGWEKEILDDGSSLQLIRDGALDDSRSFIADIDRRPIHALWDAELRFSFVNDLAAMIRGSIVRFAAYWFFSPIRVSPMSLAWLRIHVTEYDKHRVEL